MKKAHVVVRNIRRGLIYVTFAAIHQEKAVTSDGAMSAHLDEQLKSIFAQLQRAVEGAKGGFLAGFKPGREKEDAAAQFNKQVDRQLPLYQQMLHPVRPLQRPSAIGTFLQFLIP